MRFLKTVQSAGMHRRDASNPGREAWIISAVFVLPALLILSTIIQVKAQKPAPGGGRGEPINIINADELEYSAIGGTKIRKLTGNVQLQQKDATLFCDQANYFLDQNTIDAIGNVRIRQGDTIHVTGNTLHYDGNLRQANLTGSVRLTDSHILITTEQLDYDLNTRVASYTRGGKMINDSAVLTSRRGYYHANTAEVYFRQDVELLDPKYKLSTDTLKFDSQTKIAYFVSPTTIHSDSMDVYCESGYYDTNRDIAQFEKNAVLVHPPQQLRADTIYYERNRGFGVARSNVDWSDTTSKIFLRGNFATYFEAGERVLATNQSLLISIIGDDSLFLTADTLLSFKEDSDHVRKLFAFHHVKMYKSDLQSVCDSAAFSFRDSVFRLFGDPVLWVDGNQMKADTIRVYLKGNEVDRMDLLQNAFAANAADSGLYNQARGKNMYGIFRNGALDHMQIIGNGESVYYAKDESGGYIGVNKAVCSNMTLYFDSARQVSRIFFLNKPDATLFPLGSFPQEESRLRNFVWLDSLRPKSKEDLFR